jgi:N-dimethylarginine dimethylaminohydrolase
MEGFMFDRPHLLVTDPAHFEVSYAINPWMRPGAWGEDPQAHSRAARSSFEALVSALETAGARVEALAGAPGLPDLVFPANAAVVLDGKAMMARFRCPERQGEEAVFTAAFQRLRARGVLTEVIELPKGRLQEGAGDAIWDAPRQHFWVGYGPRSDAESPRTIAEVFGQEVVALELATDEFYHLDTCFLALSGGEVLYYPRAFTPAARARIRAHVAPDKLFEASAEDANAFCINAVNIGRQVVMACAPEGLRALMARLGYQLTEVDLSPFILSGGAAYCMSLRLDRRSDPHARTEPQTQEAVRHDLVGS